MNFRCGPIIGLAVVFASSIQLSLMRLRSDIRTVGEPEGEGKLGIVPFRANSIYAAHRRLLPKSPIRKILVFSIGTTAFGMILYLLAFCLEAWA